MLFVFQNYNKSRIHSYRGARDVVITLDDVPIFKGEIAQACGSVNGRIESFGDVSFWSVMPTFFSFIRLKIKKKNATSKLSAMA